MADHCVGLENFELLKALYDFKATFPKTLSFQENDHFVLYESDTKERNWWQVLNSKGQVGYIPSNYVTTVKVHPQVLMDFVEKKHQAQLGRKPKKQAPLPPDFGSTTPVKESPINFNNIEVKTSPSNSSARKGSLSEQRKQSLTREAQSDSQIQHKDSQRKLSESSQKREIFKNNSQSSIRQSPNQSPAESRSSSLRDTNSRIAELLLELVRINTQLSHEKSKVAATVVLIALRDCLPPSISHYFDAILSQLERPLLNVEDTSDANRLKIIFSELTSCKEDSQQRSWMLYEDELTICEYIKELTSILTNADANVSRHVLVKDQYDGVCTLIQYYQMETRWTIRQLLLQSFGVMCSLDHVVLKIMLESILPMELARDMKSNPRNVEKLNYSSLLLTMIFSMGEPMPITHFEQVGSEFISFLLNLIENPPDTDLDDQIPDQFVNLILSYNLQFNASDNVIMDALGERTVAKIFTEKVLFLLNRGIDPVRIFDHKPAPSDSVLKIFIDLFASDDTASLFYTNDIKVLIDIILRQLYDTSPGEKRRQYLELCRRVLKMASYNDHRHRCDDILRCFTRIFCEETPESQDDQNLVREISNEFPHLFKM